MIQSSPPVVITKKLSRAGRTLSLSIPKEIVELLGLDDHSVVEVSLKKLIPSVVPAGKLVGK